MPALQRHRAAPTLKQTRQELSLDAQTAELSTTIMFWQHRAVLWQEVVTKPAATSPLHHARRPLRGPLVPCAPTGGLEGATWKMEEYRPFSCRYVMPRLARPAKYGRIQNSESKRNQSKQPGAQPNHELQSEDYKVRQTSAIFVPSATWRWRQDSSAPLSEYKVFNSWQMSLPSVGIAQNALNQ